MHEIRNIKMGWRHLAFSWGKEKPPTQECTDESNWDEIWNGATERLVSRMGSEASNNRPPTCQA